MKYTRLSADLKTRYDEAGGGAYGEPFVDETGNMRWFTREELDAMTGVGVFTEGVGHSVYEDAYGAGRARLA